MEHRLGFNAVVGPQHRILVRKFQLGLVGKPTIDYFSVTVEAVLVTLERVATSRIAEGVGEYFQPVDSGDVFAIVGLVIAEVDQQLLLHPHFLDQVQIPLVLQPVCVFSE